MTNTLLQELNVKKNMGKPVYTHFDVYRNLNDWSLAVAGRCIGRAKKLAGRLASPRGLGKLEAARRKAESGLAINLAGRDPVFLREMVKGMEGQSNAKCNVSNVDLSCCNQAG